MAQHLWPQQVETTSASRHLLLLPIPQEFSRMLPGFGDILETPMADRGRLNA